MTDELPYIQTMWHKGRPRHYYRRGKYRVRLPDAASPEFQSEYQRAEAGFAAYDAKSQASMAEYGAEKVWRACLTKAVSRAQERATAKKVAFAIDAEMMRAMFAAQQGRCAVSGVKFRPYSGGSRVNPYQPSIDRIDPPKGYVPGNVRLVLHAVNVGLSDMPLSDYVAVCAAVARKHRGNVVPSSEMVQNGLSIH